MKLAEIIEVKRIKEAEISREQDKKMAKVMEDFLADARKELQGKIILVFSDKEFSECDFSFPSVSVEEIIERAEAAGFAKIIKVKDVAESDKEAFFDCVDEKDMRHPIFFGMVLAEVV